MHIYDPGYEEIDEFHVSWYKKNVTVSIHILVSFWVYDHSSDQNIDI